MIKIINLKSKPNRSIGFYFFNILCWKSLFNILVCISNRLKQIKMSLLESSAKLKKILENWKEANRLQNPVAEILDE